MSGIAIDPLSWEGPLVKTTLDLPEDLMREVKLRAAKEGKKLKEIFSALSATI